jgi:hypothetical protein
MIEIAADAPAHSTQGGQRNATKVAHRYARMLEPATNSRTAPGMP